MYGTPIGQINALDVALASELELHDVLRRHLATERDPYTPELRRLRELILECKPSYVPYLKSRLTTFQRDSVHWMLCKLFCLEVEIDSASIYSTLYRHPCKKTAD